MATNIAYWTTPPVLDNEEQTRLAALVHAVLIQTIVLTIAGSIAGNLIALGNPFNLISCTIILILEVITLAILQKKRVQTAAFMLIISLWLSVTIVSVLMGGINAATIPLFMVITLIAGLTIGGRGNMLITACSIVVLFVFYIIDGSEYPIPIRLGSEQNNIWLTSIIGLIATSVFVNHALSNMNHALQTAQHKQEQLIFALNELQHTTVSKTYIDSILNSMLNMLIVIDENLQIVTVNQATVTELHHEEHCLLGQSFAAVLASDAVHLIDRLQAILNGDEKAFHIHTRYRTHHGDTLQVEFTASLLQMSDAEKRIVCVAQDITDRVETEEALLYSERHLQTVMQHMNAFLFAVDQNGICHYCDGRGLDELPLKQGNSIGQSVFTLCKDYPNFLQDIQQILMEGTPLRSTSTFGDQTFETHYNPTPDGGFVAFAINITERIDMEQTLERERNLLRTLIDTLPNYIHVKDLDERYILINKAYMDYCGIDNADDVIGKTSNDVSYDETVVTSHLEDTRIVMEDGIPVVHTEREGTRADGKKVWLQITKVPLYNAEHKMMGIVSVSSDITQRKEDEERLRASEARLRAVVTNAPVFIFAIDRHYDLTFFEGHGTDELQLETFGKVLGHSLFIPASGTSELEVASAVDHAFKGENTKSHISIPPLTFDIRYSPIYNADGDITGVTGIAIDITERKRAEEALKESEARNRAIIDTLPDMLFVVNKDGIFTDYNIGDFLEATLPEDKIIGSSIYDIPRTKGEGQTVQSLIETCLATGERQSIEYRLINQHGKEEIFESRYGKLNDNEVLALVRDITEARHAQEEVRRKDRMYRTLARNLPNSAVMLFDHDLRYLIAEGTILEELKSVYEGNIEGHTLFEIMPAHFARFLATFHQRTLVGEIIHHELPLDLNKKIYSCTFLPLRNDDEDIYAGMLVVLDVTEDRNKTRELQQFTEELERSNRELQEFAYVASHDLQEPLRKIRTFGDRLKSGSHNQLDATSQDYLNRMMNAAERMQQLIQGLLTLSRVTTQAKPFQLTDLNDVLQSVLTNLDLKIEQTNTTIHVTNLPNIEAEYYQMQQLFQNLLINAMKYSLPDVYPVIHITSEQDVENGEPIVKIKIQDNGIGFENEYAERIFGVFQRLHSRSEYEGTGMGLAICRRIVERHNGMISAEGEPNVGATFTIVLPVIQQQLVEMR